MNSILPPKVLALKYILCFCLVSIFSIPQNSHASVGSGSGWFNPVAEYVGVDTTTCGPNATVGQVELVERDSNIQISGIPNPSSVDWYVKIYSEAGTQLYTWTAPSGVYISPKFCYQLSSDRIEVSFTNTVNNKYRTFHMEPMRITPKQPNLYHGHSYKSLLHVTQYVISPEDLKTISPLWIDTVGSPTVTAQVNTLPTLYGVTGIDSITSSVYKFTFPAVKSLLQTQITNVGNGGAGSYTLPKFNIPGWSGDGLYWFTYYANLNGSKSFNSPNITNANIPVSSTVDGMFMLDTTGPITSVSHVQNSTTDTTADVSITNTFSDVTSRVSKTTIHLKEKVGTAETITIFDPVAIPPFQGASMQVTTNATVQRGIEYEYYAVSIDQVGNISTSTKKSILVAYPPNLPTAEIISPTPTAPDTFASYLYNAQTPLYFDSQAKNSLGVALNQSDVDWEWRIGNCQTGTLYSSSKAFDISPNPPFVIPFDGSVNNVYLRVREKATGLWSVNCPVIPVKYSCQFGYLWNGTSCNYDPSLYANLISQNLTLNTAGPLNTNMDLSLSFMTYNAGPVSTNHRPGDGNFYSKLYYSWDNSNWTEAPFIAFQPQLSSASSVSYNNVTFWKSLLQTGNIYFRHCVDTTSKVDEGPDENPNCDVIGPYVVNSGIDATLIGNDCDIAVGSNSCSNALLTWEITGATNPNIFNVTSNSTLSTSALQNNFPLTLQYGANIIRARDNVNSIKEITLTADCDPLTGFWNVNVCSPLPTITISGDPELIRPGTQAEFSIDIQSNFNLVCIVRGIEASPSTINHIAGSNTYNITSRPLNSDQVVNVTCTEPITGTDVTSEYRIGVSPNYVEI